MYFYVAVIHTQQATCKRVLFTISGSKVRASTPELKTALVY
jgi:hypothetical protein